MLSVMSLVFNLSKRFFEAYQTSASYFEEENKFEL